MGRLTELQTYDYYLPRELIAHRPARPRDLCRLMVVSTSTGIVEHKRFADIVEMVEPGELMVVNNTKVIRARLFGRKRNTGGKVEILLLRRLGKLKKMASNFSGKSEKFKEVWETITRPRRRIREGVEIEFRKGGWANSSPSRNPQFVGRVLSRENGKSILGFDFKGTFEENLEKIGEVPIPHYIGRNFDDKFRLQDRKWYQTVFAKKEGAVAAPTAGLHFTRRLWKRIETKGVRVVPLTLHIGWGTFKPVRKVEIARHRLDAEYFELNVTAARAINEAIRRGKRVIAVGTSTVRALESCCLQEKPVSIPGKSEKKWLVVPRVGWTDLFIYPGYEFKVVDGLITNFHLPKSSLLMLVAAFGGMENIRHAYEEAMREKYRFYSYGDAMFLI